MLPKALVGLVLLFLLSGMVTPLFADTPGADVVYLKDGSVLRGTITSLTQKDITIVTSQGVEFTVALDKVDRFERKSDAGASSGAGGGTPSSPSSAAGAGTSLKPFAVEANILGLLQFGPYVRMDIRLMENLYLAPHIRIGYAGALGWLLFGTADIGAGFSLLYFFPSDVPNRFYIGSFTDVSLNLDGQGAVNVGANFGYRWRFPNGSYWNTGVIAGGSYNFTTDYAFFFGMAELSWGFEF